MGVRADLNTLRTIRDHAFAIGNSPPRKAVAQVDGFVVDHMKGDRLLRMLQEDANRLIALHESPKASTQAFLFGMAPVIIDPVEALRREIDPHELEIAGIRRVLL